MTHTQCIGTRFEKRCFHLAVLYSLHKDECWSRRGKVKPRKLYHAETRYDWPPAQQQPPTVTAIREFERRNKIGIRLYQFSSGVSIRPLHISKVSERGVIYLLAD